MIDLDSAETVLLANPRAPAVVDEETLRRLDRESGGPGRIWSATSGTRGATKLVALRREAILASADAVNRHLGATHADAWLLALPTFHVGGLGVLARAHRTGARVIEPFRERRWSAETFLAAARDRGARLSALVPAQLFDLVETGSLAPESLRALVIGGGRLSATLRERARDLGWPVLPSYGLTECASQVATATPDSPDLRLLDHVEARVSETGRIEISSPALLDGHLVPGEGFRDPKVDGWLETEDRGAIEGRTLRVAGREASFAKIGGESVDLEALRATLERLRRETGTGGDATVVAAPDARLGTVIVLVVEESVPEADARALRQSFDAEVMPYERARRIVRVERIPRSALGKLRLGAIRDQLDASG